MKIPPVYTITPEMIDLITKIEAHKIHFSTLEIPNNIKDKIQRVSLLKSSLYSARIEGNPLNINDVSFDKSSEKNKNEIFNIIKASKFIESKKNTKKITKDTLLEIHKIILKNINSEAGFFRIEQSAIFNQAGIAVYVTPSPLNVPTLVNKLIDYINKDDTKLPLITAFISHLVFEKIHPFLDGNGRAGRLLISLVLKTKDWNLNFAIPFEEYLDENKDEYYFNLDQGITNTNDYLVYMLNAYLFEIEKIKKQITEETNNENGLFLPPRQEEILNIIKDHSILSFDMIKRRFLKVPERTLRYDLKKLTNKGLVEKTGETKGSYYRIKQVS